MKRARKDFVGFARHLKSKWPAECVRLNGIMAPESSAWHIRVWCFLCGAIEGTVLSPPAHLPGEGVPPAAGKLLRHLTSSWWQSWGLSACWQHRTAETAPDYAGNVGNENLAFGVMCALACLFRCRLLQLRCSLASNALRINQKIPSRTCVCLLAAPTLQCTSLQGMPAVWF